MYFLYDSLSPAINKSSPPQSIDAAGYAQISAKIYSQRFGFIVPTSLCACVNVSCRQSVDQTATGLLRNFTRNLRGGIRALARQDFGSPGRPLHRNYKSKCSATINNK